ncbi:sulfotransferase family protein [Defluviimonas sp. WL0002]|uniref:Sulfotransferase family protein n=1 Tax=Albidovulum marisflavi TaxID=2984159 RepID=A0ABT2ZEC1_9RHOB|nr:sulfotransferase family protein [Defluviimonas sp. WL0002]MCV2869480.1 sulfotransferase family protein [Defluviimonas sp. WL0002]
MNQTAGPKTMLVSTSHHFIFVHIPKTAGTSIDLALRDHSLPRATRGRHLLAKLNPFPVAPDRVVMPMHSTAAQIRRKMGSEAYAQFTSFAFVRNPFDHALSHYEYLKLYRYERVARRVASMSIEEYLRWRMAARPWDRTLQTGRFVHLPDQAAFVVDGKGKVIVDRVMKFETLTSDFERLCRELKVPVAPLEHRRKTERAERSNLREQLSDQAVGLIRRLYARDFELFGYSAEPN